MFGFGITKHKRKLSEAFEACFWPVMDQLGNVPIPMQSDPAINASILAVCETYALSQNITKQADIALIADTIFEEIYRLESMNVQNRVDVCKNEENAQFIQAYENARAQTNADLNLRWLTAFAKENFKPATGLML